VIKVEGGEKENTGEKMGKKKKRSFLERAIEGLTGAFIMYLSGSATNDLLKGVLVVIGFVLVIYAVASD
jgi:hypothetical protein